MPEWIQHIIVIALVGLAVVYVLRKYYVTMCAKGGCGSCAVNGACAKGRIVTAQKDKD